MEAESASVQTQDPEAPRELAADDDVPPVRRQLGRTREVDVPRVGIGDVEAGTRAVVAAGRNHCDWVRTRGQRREHADATVWADREDRPTVGAWIGCDQGPPGCSAEAAGCDRDLVAPPGARVRSDAPDAASCADRVDDAARGLRVSRPARGGDEPVAEMPDRVEGERAGRL